MKIKRSLSALLALLIMLTAIPQLAFAADDIHDNENTGSGGAGGSVNNASTWNTSQQGYRFVIVDQSLTPVSNVVDILFQVDANALYAEQYRNSRATSLSTDNSNHYLYSKAWSQIVADSANLDPLQKLDTPPPAAIGWMSGNKAVSLGLAFKDWFMGTDEYVGGRVPDITPDSPNYVEKPNGGGTGGGIINPPKPDEAATLAKQSIYNTIAAASASMYRETQAMFEYMTTLRKNAENGIYTRSQCLIFIDGLNAKYTSRALRSKLEDIYIGTSRGLDTDYGSSEYSSYMRSELASLRTTLDTIKEHFAPTIDTRRSETITALRDAMLKRNAPSTPAKDDGNTGGIGKIDGNTGSDGESPRDPREFPIPKQDTPVAKTSTSATATNPTGKFNSNNQMGLIIPLADAAEESNAKSHYMQVLNMLRADGSPLFQISGFTPTQEHTTVTEIKEKNYVVLVEPILWLKPTGANSAGQLNPNDVYGKYVYGTIGNIAEWFKANNNNTKYGGSGQGGWFASILGQVGWQSMSTGTEWVGDGTAKILPLTGAGNSNYIKISAIQEKIAAGESAALHVYTANDLANIPQDSTQTFDPTSPNPEHPAPIPPKPAVPSDPADPSSPAEPADPADPAPGTPYKINIIKFYEEDSLPVSNHTRNENPSTIKIMDEPTGNYVVDAWAISTDYVQPSSQSDTYSNTISKVTSTSDGTTPTTVKVTDPNTTLYIKLIKSGIPSIVINDLVIRESQVVKAVATADSITTDKALVWGTRVWGLVYWWYVEVVDVSPDKAKGVYLGVCGVVWGGWLCMG